MDDTELWEEIKNNDTHALKILHDHYFYQMCLYGTKVIGDMSLVEEIVSDCFIKLWSGRGKLLIQGSLKAYLFLMLRNAMIDLSRKSKKIFVDNIDVLLEIPDEDCIKEQEFYAELYRAISKLPDQRKKILELAVFESLSYKEIADKLNISVNTVKTQISRAYRFLKEELDPKSFFLLVMQLNK
ncbi:MAG: sigma-70 family RNA polymerase sigma factor [Bacteroidota bacterium]|nr:sigma-70 family RNA polymerase sigma factor [Bacteroidota bacterium]MDP4205080.1 sigma-70 family RNA polymerase sigma factor [Bacteroidota bacterium]